MKLRLITTIILSAATAGGYFVWWSYVPSESDPLRKDPLGFLEREWLRHPKLTIRYRSGSGVPGQVEEADCTTGGHLIAQPPHHVDYEQTAPAGSAGTVTKSIRTKDGLLVEEGLNTSRDGERIPFELPHIYVPEKPLPPKLCETLTIAFLLGGIRGVNRILNECMGTKESPLEDPKIIFVVSGQALHRVNENIAKVGFHLVWKGTKPGVETKYDVELWFDSATYRPIRRVARSADGDDVVLEYAEFYTTTEPK